MICKRIDGQHSAEHIIVLTLRDFSVLTYRLGLTLYLLKEEIIFPICPHNRKISISATKYNSSKWLPLLSHHYSELDVSAAEKCCSGGVRPYFTRRRLKFVGGGGVSSLLAAPKSVQNSIVGV
jgi:hypothetical protein